MYVTDELTIISYTGVDSEIAKINEKGYYYFDGIEWVKTSWCRSKEEEIVGKIYIIK